MKKEEIQKKIVFIYFIFLIPHSNLFCETPPSIEENYQLIREDICRKMDYLRNISFQCGYRFFEHHKAYENGIFIESNYEHLRSYTYERGNYVKVERFEKKEKNLPVTENPSNLLELLSLKANQNLRTSSAKYSDEIVYCYNGRVSIRSIREDEHEGVVIWQKFKDNVDLSGTDADPRCLIGFFGISLFTNFIREPPLHIVEYLKTPGKSFYYEKNGYKILWHYAGTFGKGILNSGIEIWIDSQGRIVKMIEGIFFTRLLGEERLKQFFTSLLLHNLSNQVSHEFPLLIHRIYEWDNFIQIEDDIYMPLKCTITRYNYAEIIPESDFLSKENDIFGENDIFEKNTRLPWLIVSSAIGNWIPQVTTLMEIYEETFKLVSDIPDEVFIAPEPTIPHFDTPEEREKFFETYYEEKYGKEVFEKSKITWQFRYKSFFFIIGFILLTLLSIIFTKRYLGWGI